MGNYTDNRGLVNYVKATGMSIKEYKKLSPPLKKIMIDNLRKAQKTGEAPF